MRVSAHDLRKVRDGPRVVYYIGAKEGYSGLSTISVHVTSFVYQNEFIYTNLRKFKTWTARFRLERLEDTTVYKLVLLEDPHQ